MKKLVAVLISMVLLISSLGASSIAANTTEKPSIGFDSIEAEAGETISLPLYVRNNSGIAGLAISLKYDTNVLTLSETKGGSLFSGFTKGKNFVWDESENVTVDGVLATFTFTVAEQAPAGEYDIQVIVRSCVDIDLNDVACNTISGTVNVKAKPVVCTHTYVEKVAEEYLKSAATTTAKAVYYKSCSICGEKSDETFEYGEKLPSESTAKIVVESQKDKLRAGQTVQVDVSIQNNPGFGGMAYDVNYDNTVLELVSYELGIGSEICTDSGMDIYPDKMNFQYAGISNVTGDGVLVSLTFKVKDSAPVGSTTISVIPEEGTFFFYQGRVEIDFTVECEDGNIEVVEYMPGDINGDDKVNNRDAARLMQYLAGWDVEAVELALDVNGDEKINNRDAARLMQYLAGWDVEIY